MTDRLKGLVVTLEHDIREDDAESIMQAIRHLRGVEAVEPRKVDIDDQMNRTRIKHEIRRKLFSVLDEDTK
jgi:hypothetical protein